MPNCWELDLSLLFQSCEAVHRHGFYEEWKPKDAAEWVEATDGRDIEKQTGDDKITRWVIIPSKHFGLDMLMASMRKMRRALAELQGLLAVPQVSKVVEERSTSLAMD